MKYGDIVPPLPCIDDCTCAGVEHGQHDLHPDSAAAPGQRDGARCVQRKTFLWSCRQHCKGQRLVQ